MSEPARDQESRSQARSDPTERHAGDEADFVWHDTGIGIGFEKLHEEKDGLKGEISVVRGGQRNLVYFSTFNLTAGETRERLGKSLEKKTGIAEALWQEYLTYACWETTQAFREGAKRINLRHHVARPLSYLVKGILPIGDTSVIYGDGSSTKSLNALALATAAVTGRKVGVYQPLSRAIACLYVDYETYEDEQKRRYDRVMNGLGLDPDHRPDLYYYQTFRPLAQEGARLRKEIDLIRSDRKQPDGHVVVVIDSIAWAVGGEVLPEVVIPFFNTLRSLGAGVSRIVVSHVSKSDATRAKGAATPYGSVFVRNAARSAHEYVATEAGGGARRVGIFHRKTNSSALEPDMFVRVHFDDSEDRTGPITFSVDAEARTDAAMAMKSGSVKDRLLAVLSMGPADTMKAALEAGASPTVARAKLNELKQAGLVTPVPGPPSGDGRPATIWHIRPGGPVDEQPPLPDDDDRPTQQDWLPF